MVPAMIPPPMPLKLFEFAAGVFEMKAVAFFLAIAAGKFLRFLLWAIITVYYGPTLIQSFTHSLRRHTGLVLAAAGILIVLLAAYAVRKIFDRRRGTPLPIEDAPEDQPVT